jgi:hypothetical protein
LFFNCQMLPRHVSNIIELDIILPIACKKLLITIAPQATDSRLS